MDNPPSPQLCAVGEEKRTESQSNQDAKLSYASQLVRQSCVAANANLELCPVTVEKGIPTIEFTVEEMNTFTKEEGLQQAVVIKFSYGKPELQELRQILPKQLEVKGNCNIGQLEYRHILVRFDLFEDFANVVSRTTGYVKAKGDDFFFRTFPWTMGFNPREETPKAVVWISFPELPANFFAKKSLMSIAAAVGKPISVDKATKDRTRPSMARVKVLINLLDKQPQKVKINIVDTKSGKIIEYDQRIVFDNLPKYCTCCKHQGHDVKACRWNTNELKEQAIQIRHSEDRGNLIKLKGDARELLNANRAARSKESVQPGISGLKNAAGGTAELKNDSDQMEQVIEVQQRCQDVQPVPIIVNDTSEIELPKENEAAGEKVIQNSMEQSAAHNVLVLVNDTSEIEPSKDKDNVVTAHLDNAEQSEQFEQIPQVDLNGVNAHLDIAPSTLNAQFEIGKSEQSAASVEKDLNHTSKGLDMQMPTYTVPLNDIDEHMVQMHNTMAENPEDPSTIQNAGSKQILTDLNADIGKILQANPIEHNATSSKHNLNTTDKVHMQTVNELQSKRNIENGQTQPNLHSDHKMLKQTFATAEDINQEAIVQPHDTGRVLSQQSAGKNIRKEESPISNNKKHTEGNRSVIPLISNSFDALNIVNDDDQNSETKRATHANDTKIKSIIAPIVPKRAKSRKSKTWKDQREYDDEETWGEGLASFSWEEEDIGSEEDSDDSVTQEIQKKNSSKNSRANLKQTASSNRSLNYNAPVYVPRNNTNANSSMEGTSKVYIHNHQLSTEVTSVDDHTTTLQTSNSHKKEQQYNLDVDRVALSQTKQLVTTESAISAEKNIEGNHLDEEGEEEDFINQCRADVFIKRRSITHAQCKN